MITLSLATRIRSFGRGGRVKDAPMDMSTNLKYMDGLGKGAMCC
jgi:hypothetical protein